MLAGFYVLSIESYLATYTMGHFHLSQGLFGPTELRILLAVGNFVLLTRPYADIAGHRFLLFDVGGDMIDIAVAAEMNLVGDTALVAAEAAREAGNSPNTVMAAALSLLGPACQADARRAMATMIDLFAQAGIRCVHEEFEGGHMNTPYRYDRSFEVITKALANA